MAIFSLRLDLWQDRHDSAPSTDITLRVALTQFCVRRDNNAALYM
jgi:hypothetical protein